MSSNELYLDTTNVGQDQARETRDNALFIYAKLVAGGMSVALAKGAVEALYDAGDTNGFNRGYEAGIMAAR